MSGAPLIEFIAKRDPMVQRLLRKRVDYDQDLCERLLAEHFDVGRRCALTSGNRTVYFATPRRA